MGAEWFKNAIIYHIFIDRFADYKYRDWKKPEFMGGTIQGIIDKLDYIKELGVNTIWISPFYETSAYHGYHITNFFKVDPHFGTLTDIKELINKVHGLSMKIITDFVPNHCSDEHPFFVEARKNKKSEYYHWFYFKKWPKDYLCFLSVKELPKLNLDHPAARDEITRAAKYWLSLGFDGFRLDHVIGPKHTFWKYFREQIKKDYPDAVLIGEAWMKGIKFRELKTINLKNKFWKWLFRPSPDSMLKSYLGELDGVLDFRFQETVRDYIAGQKKPRLKLVQKKLKEHFSKFPKDYFLPTFLDNHDMNRFLFECGNNKEKLKQAAEIQFSIKQPIIIYYGTEIGMTQQRAAQEMSENGDLQARQPMQWEEQNQDLELLEFYKDLIKKRLEKD